jgi:hypothetical protein
MGLFDVLRNLAQNGPPGVAPKLNALAHQLRTGASFEGSLGGYVPLGGGPEYRRQDLVNQQQRMAEEWAAENPKTALLHGLVSGGQPGGAATVFHGSPHLFNKFSLGKVGTGEGAQAYGHGLYFADNPAIAKSYADKLGTIGHYVDGRRAAINAGSPEGFALEALKSSGQSAQPAKRYVEALHNAGLWNDSPAEYRQVLSAIDKYAGRKVDTKVEANLYSVDLPDPAIAKMLDWDKPLSAQSEHVKASLQKVASPIMKEAFDRDWTAHKLIKTLEERLGTEQQVPNSLPGITQKVGGKEAATRLLRDAGIPGTQYLDAGSRGAGTGTRNYVVFDDSLLRILSRE